MPALAICATALWPDRWRELTGVLAVLVDTRLGLVLLCGAVLLGRLGQAAQRPDELAYLSGVAAQLRSGTSLRHAIVAMGETGGPAGLAAARLAAAGTPMGDVATALRPALPVSARQAEMALTAAALSGGRLADAVDAVAQFVFDEAELAREVAGAISAAKASAVLIAALPAAGVLVLGAGGRLETLADLGTLGAVMIAIGSGLLIGGAVVMGAMVRGVLR